MSKNVLCPPTAEVQPNPVGQEPEARLGQLLAPLARQHGIELRLERMQMQHVGSGIGELWLGQLSGTPVRELKLLGEVDVQKFACQVLEAMLVGIGAGESRGD